MSDKTIEEFWEAKDELDRALMKLVTEFEEEFNCLVTEINPPDHERESTIGLFSDRKRRWIQTSRLTTKVEF